MASTLRFKQIQLNNMREKVFHGRMMKLGQPFFFCFWAIMRQFETKKIFFIDKSNRDGISIH